MHTAERDLSCEIWFVKSRAYYPVLWGLITITLCIWSTTCFVSHWFPVFTSFSGSFRGWYLVIWAMGPRMRRTWDFPPLSLLLWALPGFLFFLHHNLEILEVFQIWIYYYVFSDFVLIRHTWSERNDLMRWGTYLWESLLYAIDNGDNLFENWSH